MQGYNCVMIYSTDEEKILFCRRLSDPYKGKFNLVGGKIEEGEDHFDAAYRELFEETGIRRGDVELVSEKHPLCWLDSGEDFFDLERFAGEGNIGHMVQQVKDYGRGKRGK